MKKILIFIMILCVKFQNFAQTNLICNGSFEEVNQDVFTKLNIGSKFYPNHLSNDPEESLFHNWYYTNYNPGGSASQPNIYGLSLGIVPNLFQITNHTLFPFEDPTFIPGLIDPIEPDYSFTPPKILKFSSSSFPAHLKLTQSTTVISEYGMDLSPPNTKFGENVYPTEGSNYFALVDFENYYNGKPWIQAKLKSALVVGVEYTFLMDYAKMNLLESIKSNDEWGKIKDGKLKVWVCNSDFNDKKLIFKAEVENESWSNYNQLEAPFIANKAYTHILIEYDPILEGPIVLKTKISGVFIDNLKLFESCETPATQCLNGAYRRDLIDVKLDKVDNYADSTFALTGSGLGHIKTIRAKGLHNAKLVKIRIFPSGSSSPIRTVDLLYPPGEWIWDGNDDGGNPRPEGNYKARIILAENECFSEVNVDEKNFNFQRNYTVFNISTSTSIVDGNTVIFGLDNVSNLNIKIYSSTGAFVSEYNITDPRPTISIGSETGCLDCPDYVAPGIYNFVITASNNCATTTFNKNGREVNPIVTTGTVTYLSNFDWSPYPKPSTFPCPFNFDYKQNFLPPLDCCEGDLYLHDVEIWNSWDVNIAGFIHIGDNVVFQPGSVNNLYAGQQITGIPGSIGVVIQDETLLQGGTFNCATCIAQTISINEWEEEEIYDSIQRIVEETTTSPTILDEKYSIYPNPVLEKKYFTLRIPKNVDIYSIKNLKLISITGSEIEISIHSNFQKEIKIVWNEQLVKGTYYLNFDASDGKENLPIVIN